MKIIPNKYHDLKKLCWSCGFPIANNSDPRAKVCHSITKSETSNCKKAKDRYDQGVWQGKNPKSWRVIARNKSKQKIYPQQAMRPCLRCDEDINGVIPTFLSKGPWNRVCEPCSMKQASVKVNGLSRVGGIVEGFEFMYPS